jgi:Ca-activated chloride channel family protein
MLSVARGLPARLQLRLLRRVRCLSTTFVPQSGPEARSPPLAPTAKLGMRWEHLLRLSVQRFMQTLRSALLLLALLAFSARASAIGLIVIPEQPGWRPPIIIEPPPWPRPPRPPIRQHAFAPLELVSAKVNTTIKDQVATTAVEQEFYNPNAARLEGTFLFPVPKGAHLDKFRMEIDGKLVEAELLGADKARGIYENIVRSMRDPALLEYEGRDVFKVRIFPIEPNSRKRVAFSYTQLLKADTGLVTYALPLGAQKYSAAPVKQVSVKVDLQTTRPLKAVYSPSHQVEVRRDGERRATAGFEGANVPADADFTLYFSAEQEAIGLSLLTHRPAGEDGYFLLLASPGADTKEVKPMPKDVAFVLDTSGSMSGKKLEQAKKALQFCVENLAAEDRFDIIRFATEAEPLFTTLTEATAANRAKAASFVAALKPIGGTAIDDALGRALALRPAAAGRPFVVIFLTDGCPTVGVTDEKSIVARVTREAGGTRVFVFGLGTDVNTHLLDKVAEESRAFAQYVLPDEDLEVKLSSFFAKIRDPMLADPRLGFSGDIRVSKLYPSPLPDVFRGDQLVLVGRYAGEGSSAATLEGSVGGTPRKFVEDVRFPGASGENEFIPRLWATRRVGFLLDEIRLRGENSELKEEVTELARKYGIVTPLHLVPDRRGRGSSRGCGRGPEPAPPPGGPRGPGQREPGLPKPVTGARGRWCCRQCAVWTGVASGRQLGPGHDGARRRGAKNNSGPRPRRPPRASSPVPVATASRRRSGQMCIRSSSGSWRGRAFFQNGARWVDSQVQQQAAAVKRVPVEFGSPEYFALLRQHPEAAPWLALGQNVDLVLAGMIYTINAPTAE